MSFQKRWLNFGGGLKIGEPKLESCDCGGTISHELVVKDLSGTICKGDGGYYGSCL